MGEVVYMRNKRDEERDEGLEQFDLKHLASEQDRDERIRRIQRSLKKISSLMTDLRKNAEKHNDY